MTSMWKNFNNRVTYIYKDKRKNIIKRARKYLMVLFIG